jgi:EmrB/QacA subfamily drug resistance transporter
MSATNLDDEAQTTAQVDPNRWRALVIILIAPFLSVLDFFIVNISIPSIQSGLHVTFAEVQLVIAGYGLTYAVFLVTGGRLGDIYGRKRMFMLGMGGFTLASALCGFAHSPNMLIGSRLLQGLMAALMVPQTLAIVQTTFPAKERSLAFGSFGATLGLASIAGQLLGGLLISANLFGLTWRPIFLVNLPVGIIALFLAWPILKESRSPKCLRLDPGGVGIVSVALFLLVYPLVKGREAGWPTWTYLSVAGSIVMLAGFVFYERWKERRDGSPLVALSLFSDRAFVIGLGIIVLFFGGLASFFLTLTVFLQTGLNFTPLAAGLAFAPFAVGFFAASTASVKLQPKFKSRILNLGAGLMIVGLLWLAHTVRVDGIALHGSNLIPVLLVYGIGQGFVVAPLFNIILSGIGGEDAGSASGVLSTMQQIASAIGVALIGSIFFGLLGSGGNPGAQNYVGAFATTLLYNAGLLAATFLLVLFLPQGCTGRLQKEGVSGGAINVHA